MLGEGSRGAILEITLAKILHTSSKSWLQLMSLSSVVVASLREVTLSLSAFVLLWLLLKNVARLHVLTAFTHLGVN